MFLGYRNLPGINLFILFPHLEVNAWQVRAYGTNTSVQEIGIEDVVRGIYYVTLRYRNNLQQQIELMILPPGINLLNYGWMPGVEGSVRLNYSYIYQR